MLVFKLIEEAGSKSYQKKSAQLQTFPTELLDFTVFSHINVVADVGP